MTAVTAVCNRFLEIYRLCLWESKHTQCDVCQVWNPQLWCYMHKSERRHAHNLGPFLITFEHIYVFVQPDQDHPDRVGAVCPAADPVPAAPEAPPDAALHDIHRRQQGQSRSTSLI